MKTFPTGLLGNNCLLLIVSFILLATEISAFPLPDFSNAAYTQSPFAMSEDNLVGQCTWYVYGRIQETGMISSTRLSEEGIFLEDAGNWLADTEGFETGDTPRAGAIAVWANHVAFIENDAGEMSQSNSTPNVGNDVVIGTVSNLHSNPSSTSNITWEMPRFTVMNVVSGPVSDDFGYQWFELSGSDYSGWCAWKKADLSGPAYTNDNPPWWNITRIQTLPAETWYPSTDPTYIYLDASSAPSNVITVDTRDLVMNDLVISGPTSVSTGGVGSYTATLFLEGSEPRDVTHDSDWRWVSPELDSLAGQFEPWMDFLPEIYSGELTAGSQGGVNLSLIASFSGLKGGKESRPFDVFIPQSDDGMEVAISLVGGSPIQLDRSGDSFLYSLSAKAVSSGDIFLGVGYDWYLNDEFIGSGSQIDVTREILPQKAELRVEASSLAAGAGSAAIPVYFTGQCEFPQVPALDPDEGGFYDENLVPLTHPDPSKRDAGLIIITHGVRGSGNALLDNWLQEMANEIIEKFNSLGKPLPNIVIFDWKAEANQSSLGSQPESWDLMCYMPEDLNLAQTAGNWVVEKADFAGDFLAVRGPALEMGEFLASWIKANANNQPFEPNIDLTKPIHLIGHSAGGFVVGSCGRSLAGLASNLRVTMLDTPFLTHSLALLLPNWPNPVWLDRYDTSIGDFQLPTTSTAHWFSDYHDVHYPSGGPLKFDFVSAHSYAHQWYSAGIRSSTVGDPGFGLSPLLGDSSGDQVAYDSSPDSKSAVGLATPAAATDETLVPIDGFLSFGNVNQSTTTFSLTEVAFTNAGIYVEDYIFPPGCVALRITFQFATPGDGDFLSVSFGDFSSIYTGQDMILTREQELTVDIPVELYSELTGTLAIRLISRGEPNAVLTIRDIMAVTVEDPDGDMLSNAEEGALGTSAMLADSDADGIDDYDEVHVHMTDPIVKDTDGDGSADGEELRSGTDPLDPTSRFAVTAFSPSVNGWTIDWSSVPEKAYRIQRSNDISFGNYDVIESAIPGTPPSQTFTDTTVPPDQERVFYRIELEPEP